MLVKIIIFMLTYKTVYFFLINGLDIQNQYEKDNSTIILSSNRYEYMNCSLYFSIFICLGDSIFQVYHKQRTKYNFKKKQLL